jgi:sodium/hydrogen exchanger-like protein 3
MFMGVTTVSDNHSWNTGFVLITIACCTVYRILGVIIFAFLANRVRLVQLTLTDQIIMSYGGIRGGVAFALALILDESKIPRKKEFVTATIAVVFFTVFLQVSFIAEFLCFMHKHFFIIQNFDSILTHRVQQSVQL